MPKENLDRGGDAGLSDMAQQIKDLQTANPLENGSVDNGTLTIRSSSDGLVIEAGGKFWAKDGAQMIIDTLLQLARLNVTGQTVIDGNLFANAQFVAADRAFLSGGVNVEGTANFKDAVTFADNATVNGTLTLNGRMFAGTLNERESLEGTRVMAVGEDGRVFSIPWPSGGGTGGPVEGGGGMVAPFPWTSVTSEFGPRNIPGTSPFHRGIDFGMWPAVGGAPIPAPANGVVSSVSLHPDAGPYGFEINHGTYSDGNVLTTQYWHCASRLVNLGDTVTQGQIIGTIGNLGNSRGAHLHLQCGVSGTWVNPRAFVATYANG